MSRPLARVLELLEILQSGGTHKLASLSDRLGVDPRTARRYLGQLIELGIPVESERGRHGGYRLAAGFRLPPLMLTDEEALAVLLALPADSSARAKILRVLPDVSRMQFEALLAADLTQLSAGRPAATTTDPSILLVVAEAAGRRRPLFVRYADRVGRASHRILLPYGLVARAGRWYLSAADSLSGEVRTFRVDRMLSAEPRDGAFEVPAGFDPGENVLSGLGAPWRHRVVVRVEATEDYLRERLPAGLAALEPIPATDPDHVGGSLEGWVRVTLRVERLTWVPALLAGLDRPFVIDEPDELRDAVRTLSERLAEIGARP